MKRLLIILFIVALGAVSEISIAQDDGAVSGEFYASLSPYGSWIQLDNGLTVWHPMHMHRDWTPYRYGHWIWTDDGWYWDSDEPFGPVVYHYGRWYDDENYGWIWVPDNVWAPAWVEWRYDNDYIGWAPLAPYASFSVGVGITFSANFVAPLSYWHFVGYHHMCDPYVYNYYVPEHDRYRIYNDTRIRTNYGYSNGRVINRGVDVDYIRQRGGGRIDERRIETVSNPRSTNGRGSGNVVRAYIPSREQLAKAPDRNVQIKRVTRPSSLDVSKVNIGPRNNVARDEHNSSNRNPGTVANHETPRTNSENNNRPDTRIQNNNQPSRPNRPEVTNSNREQPRNQPRPQVNQNNRPESRPLVNQNNRPESRPLVNQNNRPESRPQVIQNNRPESRPQINQNNRAESRAHISQNNRPESRPQVRPQAQPQAREQARPQSRPQAQPQVRQQPQQRVQPQPQQREQPQPQRNGDDKHRR